MAGKRPRQIASKAFSCSELKEGHEGLLAIKKEAETEDELKKQIKDRIHICFLHVERITCYHCWITSVERVECI